MHLLLFFFLISSEAFDFSQLLVCLFILAALYDMQDLISSTRDQTWAPAVEAQSLNHWTLGEVS